MQKTEEDGGSFESNEKCSHNEIDIEEEDRIITPTPKTKFNGSEKKTGKNQLTDTGSATNRFKHSALHLVRKMEYCNYFDRGRSEAS